MVQEFKVVYTPKKKDKTIITSSVTAHTVIRPFFEHTMAYKEEAWLLCLNNQNQVVGMHKLSEGGMSSSVIDVRLVFQAALLSHSSKIMLAHNHPSGMLETSTADREITKKVKEAGKLLDIELIDHIILTESNYYSFSDEGLL